MNRPRLPDSHQSRYHDVLVHRWALKITVSSLLFILFLTLFPFDFSASQYTSLQTVLNDFSHRFASIDVIINVLLFTPLGLGLTGLLHQRSQNQLQETVSFTIVLLSCLVLSLTIETLQLFLPSRYPSFADIVSNGVGGLLGLFVFLHWRYELFYWALTQQSKNRSHLSFKAGGIMLIAYAVLIFFIASHLQTTASLGNWSLFFPLLLGNDQTHQNPWRGHVTEVAIADRSLTEADVAQALTTRNLATVAQNSLVAAYQLTNEQEHYWDYSGHSPDLIWQGEPIEIRENEEENELDDRSSIPLNSNQWLTTDGYATHALRRIRNTSQFTLGMTLATEDVEQTGPARILSFSAAHGSQNLTLGQEKSSLVIWLRTLRTTTVQKVKPELVFPDIFTDVRTHHFIITYDGSRLRCYIDQPYNQHSLEVYPGLACPFCNSLSPISSHLYRFLYYGILFAPVGYIVGLATVALRGQILLHILLLSGGLFILPFVQEFVLANTDWNRIRGDNLVISFLITASIILMVNIFKKR